MRRLNGLTREELEVIGDADKLKATLNAEWDMFKAEFLGDRHDWYTDEQVHAMINKRVAAYPEGTPEREAVEATYNLLRAIIDAGVADIRSDNELIHWIEGMESDHEIAKTVEDKTDLHLGLRPLA